MLVIVALLVAYLAMLFWRQIIALAAAALMVVIFTGVLTLVAQGQAFFDGG